MILKNRYESTHQMRDKDKAWISEQLLSAHLVLPAGASQLFSNVPRRQKALQGLRMLIRVFCFWSGGERDFSAANCVSP